MLSTNSSCSFVGQICMTDVDVDNSYMNLFDQYERVVIQALATSFGLDFLISDRHGGDVDTVHNVRKIGEDPEMTYKNKNNKVDYENRGDYDAGKYHAGGNFQEIKHTKRQEYFDDGNQNLYDEYTGESNIGFFGHSKNAPSDRNAELDHIVEAKAIHDDAGRVLADLDGALLADSETNFAWTNKKLNASMGSWANQKMQQWEKDCRIAKENNTNPPQKPRVDMEAYIEEHPELNETTKKNMLAHYRKAKKAYDAKINRVYYTSGKFWRDTGVAAAKLGLSMGLRQALGLVFTEIWFSVKDVIIECKKNGGSLFNSIAKAVKKGLQNAKKKFSEIWNKFIEGSVAGVLSSLTTTLANIFFTTAKNIIKIIRESFASLAQAAKILFINPDCYPLGERFVAAAKILATGASVVAGTMVGELLRKTPLGAIPLLNDIVPTFCNVFVTGIMSCSFLYLLDHNKVIKKAIEKLNSLPDIDNFNVSLKRQSEFLDRYLAEFAKIDFELLEKQEESYSLTAKKLSLCKTLEDTNNCLHSIYKNLHLNFPWGNYASFDSFMNDKNARLVFE